MLALNEGGDHAFTLATVARIEHWYHLDDGHKNGDEVSVAVHDLHHECLEQRCFARCRGAEEGGGGATNIGGPSNNQLIAQAEGSTYIKILATLEPLLVAPPKDQAQNISKEEKKLIKYANHWVDRMTSASKYTQKRDLLAGEEAQEALLALELEQKVRFTASEYSISGLGDVAEIVPEAFIHQADRQGGGPHPARKGRGQGQRIPQRARTPD